MATKSLVFTLIGHDVSASKSLKKLEGSAYQTGRSFGRMAFGITAALAAAGVVKWATDSFKAVAKWQEINAQTAAVVKSTGGAANITAGQMHDLAQRIESVTAVEAESIQAGGNLLLTFRNIRNEAGKGNDIFNQSTKILVDMSVALGKDVPTSAILLGKALNDPTRGLAALRRVGIQFTTSQEKQIKVLQESGDVMGAQKIILDELTTQFGGSGAAKAGTFTGKMYLLRDALGDVGEKIFKGIMPGLGKLADKGTALLNDFADSPAIDRIADFFNKWADKINASAGALVAMLQQNPKKFFQELLTALSPIAILWAIFNPGLALAGLLMGVAASQSGKLKKPMEDFGKSVQPLLPKLGELVVKLLPPLIKLAIALIPALIKLMPFFIFLAEKIAYAIEAVVGLIDVFSDMRRGISITKITIDSLTGKYGEHVRGLARSATQMKQKFIDMHRGAATWARNTAADIVRVGRDFAKFPGRIQGIFSKAKTWLLQRGKDVLQGFWNGLTSVWKKITGWISGIAGWIKKHKGPLSLDRGLLVPAGKAIMGGFQRGLQAGYEPVQKFVGGVGRRMAGSVGQWAGLASRALAMLGQPQSLLPAVLRRINLESGGNPRAINLWDSNFKAGIPSKGLMQTIDPTFNAYAGSLRGRGVYDPLANIYAGLNYALSRYGSIAAIDPLRRPYGYAMGGTVGHTGAYMVGERGPEQVVLPRGSKVIPNHRLNGSGLTVVIQSKGGIDLSKYIEVKIEQADQAAARRIRQG